MIDQVDAERNALHQQQRGRDDSHERPPRAFGKLADDEGERENNDPDDNIDDHPAAQGGPVNGVAIHGAEVGIEERALNVQREGGAGAEGDEAAVGDAFTERGHGPGGKETSRPQRRAVRQQPQRGVIQIGGVVQCQVQRPEEAQNKRYRQTRQHRSQRPLAE